MNNLVQLFIYSSVVPDGVDVIAIATSTLALKGIGIVPTANAQSDEIMKVQICLAVYH